MAEMGNVTVCIVYHDRKREQNDEALMHAGGTDRTCAGGVRPQEGGLVPGR